MVSKALSLVSKLVKQVKGLPPVLSLSHIEVLNADIRQLVDLLDGELFNQGCELLDYLGVYKALADICFHEDRPAKFAHTDRAVLTTRTTALKLILRSRLEEIQHWLDD